MFGASSHGELFGAKLENLDKVQHGIASKISITDPTEILFCNLPPLQVGRYHSWVIKPSYSPEFLKSTAVDANNQIMALKHTDFDFTWSLIPSGKYINSKWKRNFKKLDL